MKTSLLGPLALFVTLVLPACSSSDTRSESLALSAGPEPAVATGGTRGAGVGTKVGGLHLGRSLGRRAFVGPEKRESSGAPAWQESLVTDPSGGPPESFVLGDTERLQRIAPPEDDSLAVYGVDLGVGIVAEGQVHLLFGDAWSAPSLWDRDPVAALGAGAGPADTLLSWQRDPAGTFRPLGFTAPVATGTFSVPVDGLEIGGRSYVFYATDFDFDSYRHATSVLAHTGQPLDFGELHVDHVAASERFINISASVDGDHVWLFASGAYRKSPVYLARATTETLGDRQSWQYFAGMHGSELTFAHDETGAVPLTDSECVGELSVRRDPARELYLMTYNCLGGDEARGIHLRVAKAPWGPWSEPIVVFDPERDGYGSFMHRAVCLEPGATDCVATDDGLADPGREGEWGGEYGPYLIEPWMESDGDLLTVYYTLSSWNPYAVHLMRTTLLRQRGAGPS